jgi:hypothetical protein
MAGRCHCLCEIYIIRIGVKNDTNKTNKGTGRLLNGSSKYNNNKDISDEQEIEIEITF